MLVLKELRPLTKLILFTLTSLSILSCRGVSRQDTCKDRRGAVCGQIQDQIRAGFYHRLFDRYKEVKILNHSTGSADTLDYLLLPAGVAIPAGHARAQVIRIPVQSMIVLGSPHIAQADFAGVADRITGVGRPVYRLPRRQEAADRSGAAGRSGSGLNNELVISMRPGVLMTMTNPDAAFGGSEH